MPNPNISFDIFCALTGIATANHIAKTELVRDPDSFADVVRGLHVFTLLKAFKIPSKHYNPVLSTLPDLSLSDREIHLVPVLENFDKVGFRTPIMHEDVRAVVASTIVAVTGVSFDG